MQLFPVKTKTLSSQWGIILLFSCTIIVALSSCGFEVPKSKPAILKAEAENLGSAISIKNVNNFNWTNAVIKLNSKYSSQSISTVGAGETLTLEYSSFKDEKGNSFPAGAEPNKFFISADEGTGPV